MKTTTFQTVSLLLLATAFASAQGRFSVLVTAAPTYAYTDNRIRIRLLDNNGQLTTETLAAITSAFGYKIGAIAQYAFTPNWSASTGLWYSRLGRNSLFSFSPGDSKTRIIQQDVQVPLLVNYQSSQRRLSPYFSGGALANFQQATLYRTEGEVTKAQFSQTTDYQPVLGAGISYKLSQHLLFTAQPLFIWRFKPSGYEHFVAYQVQGQLQLLYSL